MDRSRIATLIFATLAFAGLTLPGVADAKETKPRDAATQAPKSAHSSKSAKRGQSSKSAEIPKPSEQTKLTLIAAHAKGRYSRRVAAQVGSKARNRFVCNYPVDRTGHVQQGVAVYYGTGSAAWRSTASGEPLDPSALTAASPSLPLGSEADVVNLRNGRSTRVRITDRGPYGPGLMLDVTPAAAEQLGMMGSGRDRVSIIPVKATVIQ